MRKLAILVVIVMGFLLVLQPAIAAQQNNTQQQTNQSAQQNTSKLNINTAPKSDLEKLPGIGPAIAEKIIKYREQHGSFKTIDEIKKVSGIGDKKFEALKDLISVE